MKIVGVICEYNPFHRGHAAQFRAIRDRFGEDTAIVCLMSGNFVQRGAPAIFDKSLRAEAALKCGADLVLELPVTAALSSAEGFALGGVKILSQICDVLCFGAETGDEAALTATARTLLSESFRSALREKLDAGLSFPAARQQALKKMGLSGEILAKPNDILAVEYCKAILSIGSQMEIFPIPRPGDYHARDIPDPENPSASALREALHGGESIVPFIPAEAAQVFAGAAVHRLSYGEKAMLCRLRTMADAEFEALPYGSEGLWRKLMHESRRENRLEDILTAVKSKRYTRTRLDRMAMCAFLGITADDLAEDAPYVRILGFRDSGRAVIRAARENLRLLHPDEPGQGQYGAIEQRCSDLYGLFAADPEAPNAEKRRRVVIV